MKLTSKIFENINRIELVSLEIRKNFDLGIIVNIDPIKGNLGSSRGIGANPKTFTFD